MVGFMKIAMSVLWFAAIFSSKKLYKTLEGVCWAYSSVLVLKRNYVRGIGSNISLAGRARQRRRGIIGRKEPEAGWVSTTSLGARPCE